MISRRIFLSALSPFLFMGSLSAINVNGYAYISIAELAGYCGTRYSKLELKKRQSIFNTKLRIAFEVHKKECFINGASVWLGFAPVIHNGSIHIAKADYYKTLAPVLFPKKNGTPRKIFHIVLDPGHGGKDNGAMNTSLKLNEKTIALDIAKRLATELKKNGYRVSFTRTTDVYIDLTKRSEIANKLKADLFLSIHCNAASASVSGSETYYMTPRYMTSTNVAKASSADSTAYTANQYDLWNMMLSFYLQNGLKTAMKTNDRGVKKARFAVLKGLNMPGALLECGFISNKTEALKLANPTYRQSLASNITSNLIRYHKATYRA